MAFFNFLRESTDSRLIDKRPLQGWVTNINDPMQLQRIQVRLHNLHDDIADADLPWFSPSQLAAYSGSANIGDHGPIPPVGTKIWCAFNDDSQYHGIYGGGVATTTNQIPEFAGTSQTTKGVSLPNLTQLYNFFQNYGASLGSVNVSGSIHGNDTKTDTETHIHVSGTGHAVDGKGNFSATINGNANRPDNQNASTLFPAGGTIAISGGLTINVSGAITFSAKGGITLTSGAALTIQGQGKVQILSADEVDVSTTSGNINITAAQTLQLTAPAIQSSVPITVAGSSTATAPANAAAVSINTQRTRPSITPPPSTPAFESSY